MATCSVETGMLFWKKACGVPSVGNCRDCRRFVCERHATAFGDGALLCAACSPVETDGDSGSWLTWSSGSAAAGSAAAAGNAGAADEGSRSWHGPESSDSGGSPDSGSSSDSGSSDSGGGDSGGSSSD